MKKLLVSGLLGALAVGAMAQINYQSSYGRVFAYDGSAWTNGGVSVEFNGTPFFNAGWQAGVYNNTDMLNPVPNQAATFKAVTRMRVQTYVYIAGTFSGEFNVTGHGESNNGDSAHNNEIKVITNRSLRVIPYNFTGLKEEFGGTGANYANVNYSLYFAKGDGGGGRYVVTPTVQGVNEYFNGFPLDLNLEYVDPGHNGEFFLEFGRRITWVSEKAQGGKSYVSTGYLGVTVLN